MTNEVARNHQEYGILPLRSLGQGVDFDRKPQEPPLLYEDRCFALICERLRPNQFAIGPAMVDCMLDDIKHVGIKVPDALVFQTVHNPWVLAVLFEFKSHRADGIVKKFDGFTVLLRYLSKSSYLLRQMSRVLRDQIDLPRGIIIPQPEELSCITISPFGADNRPTFFVRDSPFSQAQFRLK